jgi:hypothetical protein
MLFLARRLSSLRVRQANRKSFDKGVSTREFLPGRSLARPETDPDFRPQRRVPRHETGLPEVPALCCVALTPVLAARSESPLKHGTILASRAFLLYSKGALVCLSLGQSGVSI